MMLVGKAEMGRRNACRRRRKRLDVSLDLMAIRLGAGDPSALSRWERGLKGNLPGGKSRADYEALLDRLEAERGALAS